MKILIFTTQIYQLGGAEKLAIELTHGLNNNNIESHLAILYNTPKKSSTNHQILLELHEQGFCINKFFCLNIPPNPGLLNICKAIKRLSNILQSEKYDYIETSMVTPSIIATIVTLLFKTKHIVGFHQSFQSYMIKDPKYKLFAFLTWISQKNIYYGISDFVTKSWRQSKWFHIRGKSSHTIYNNISDKLEITSRDHFLIPTPMLVEGKKILCVGRVTILKGYHILYEALKYDLERNNWHLFFVGDKHNATEQDEIIFKQIAEDIKNRSIENKVHFIGFSAEVLSYMQNCDLLVHPTAFEGFGLVIVEAMRLKVPIITTNVEAIPEILYGTGVIQLPYGDVKALRVAVNEVLNNFNLTQNDILNRSYERSMCFTLQNRVKRFLEIINQ